LGDSFTDVRRGEANTEGEAKVRRAGLEEEAIAEEEGVEAAK
jgi:hypothetical protein